MYSLNRILRPWRNSYHVLMIDIMANNFGDRALLSQNFLVFLRVRINLASGDLPAVLHVVFVQAILLWSWFFL